MGYQFNVLTGKFDRAGEGTEGPAGTVSAAGDGTATAPSISFSSDTNTGLYKSGSDSISITTGGVTGVTVDSSQNSTFAGNIKLNDAGEVRLGDNGELQLFQESATSNLSRIYSSLNSSGLSINSNLLKLKNEANDRDYLVCTNNGNVDIYGHGATVAKLSTTASGAKVTGEIHVISSGNSHGLNVYKNSNLAAYLGHIGTGDEGYLSLRNGGVETLQLNGETGGATFSGNVSTTGNLSGKNLNLLHTSPTISLTDSDGDDDFQIKVDDGLFKIIGDTDDRLTIDSSGNATFAGNIGIGADPGNNALHIENGDVRIEKDTKATIGFRGHTSGSTALAFRDSNAGEDRFTINADGSATFAGDIKLADTKQIIARGADNSTYGELDIKVAAADDSGSANVATFKRGTNNVINLAFPNGGGIDFSATADGGTVAAGGEILDDYEEGTFTASIVDEASGTITYPLTSTSVTGLYTKVGRLVHLDIRISWGGKTGSPTGNVRIQGLPFATSSATSFRTSAAIGWCSGLDFANNDEQLIIKASNGDSHLECFFLCDDQTTPDQVKFGSISSSGEWQLSLTYQT